MIPAAQISDSNFKFSPSRFSKCFHKGFLNILDCLNVPKGSLGLVDKEYIQVRFLEIFQCFRIFDPPIVQFVVRCKNLPVADFWSGGGARLGAGGPTLVDCREDTREVRGETRLS